MWNLCCLAKRKRSRNIYFVVKRNMSVTLVHIKSYEEILRNNSRGSILYIDILVVLLIGFISVIKDRETFYRTLK